MTIDKNELLRMANDFLDTSGFNQVSGEDAIRPDLVGMTMYDPPIMGVASAHDPHFQTLRRPGVIGPHFRLPAEWLPGAESVISLFLPYADVVVKTNRERDDYPSDEWLHARIEGQKMIGKLSAHLVKQLQEAGHRAVAPCVSKEFWSSSEPAKTGPDGKEIPGFTSNWSERHIAFTAGLGTFGLSTGLITEKGAAGRFTSVITDLPLAADQRPYERYDEYCTRCGACVRKCIYDAIDKDTGKDKAVCGVVVDKMLKKYYPRYGCGKCYVSVPCERRIPKKKVG